MARESREATLADFQKMAENWYAWKTVQTKSHFRGRQIQPITARNAVLDLLATTRSTWELAIVCAAYALLRPSSVPKSSNEGTDLLNIARALISLAGRRTLPDFQTLAANVSTLPYKTLIRSAPRLLAALRFHRTLTAASVSCTGYCLFHYPRNSPEFYQCLKDC
jgi:hypothetical protein